MLYKSHWTCSLPCHLTHLIRQTTHCLICLVHLSFVHYSPESEQNKEWKDPFWIWLNNVANANANEHLSHLRWQIACHRVHSTKKKFFILSSCFCLIWNHVCIVFAYTHTKATTHTQTHWSVAKSAISRLCPAAGCHNTLLIFQQQQILPSFRKNISFFANNQLLWSLHRRLLPANAIPLQRKFLTDWTDVDDDEGGNICLKKTEMKWETFA